MRQVEEARKLTPAVNREALPENALTFDERCEEGAEWCAKILSNLREKMDVRRHGMPDMPLNEQLAHLRALGWSSDSLPLCPELHAHGTGPSPAHRPLWAQRGLQVCRAEERGSRA